MSHDRVAAKAKELETRRRLGRRLPPSENIGHAVVAPTRSPRATGASGWAIGDRKDNNAA